MNPRAESFLTGLVTVLAITVGGVFLYQQIPARSSSAVADPIDSEVWEGFLRSDLKIGSMTARAQVVEFGDFQCPFCALFHRQIEGLIASMPDDITLTYLHYPLPQHLHAREAAMAAQCAAQQNRFAAIAHELYADQDSIGKRPWDVFARAAGLDDLTAFQRCMDDEQHAGIIAEHATLAARIGVTGTPTVILNGWRFRAPPHPDTLRSYVTRVIAGDNPFKRRRWWERS